MGVTPTVFWVFVAAGLAFVVFHAALKAVITARARTSGR
jgi:hypothetical protein